MRADKGSEMSDLTKEEGGESREALQQTIETYFSTLYKIAFLQLKNAEDAEDVVQEVFFRYMKSDVVFENREHEKAWFIKVTLNCCRKIWNSAWFRHRGILPEDLKLDRAALGEETEENYLKDERSRELLQAVWKLPDKYREVIHLFYYEELSVKEIAEIVGKKESTITSRLTRGRNILKKKLQEEYDFEEF